MPAFSIRKARIFYRVLGKGPALVFIHGFLVESIAYKEFLDILAEHYTVYAIDMPYHGNSDVPSNWTLDDVVEIVVALCKKIGGHPILCGHSAGGLIAMLAANQCHPKKLVLINAAGVSPYRSFATLGLALSLKRISGFLRSPRRTLAVNHITNKNLLHVKGNVSFWEIVRQTAVRDFTKEFCALRCETLFLWGRTDGVFLIRSARKCAKLVKHATFVSVPGNHDWPVLRPFAVRKHLPF